MGKDNRNVNQAILSIISKETASQSAKKQIVKSATLCTKSDISRLLDFFYLELSKEDDNPTFSTVSSLIKVKTDLIETLSFMSGFSYKDIQDTLLET